MLHLLSLHKILVCASLKGGHPALCVVNQELNQELLHVWETDMETL